MIKTHTMTNIKAMQALKQGKFEGHLIEFHTSKNGNTTISEHTKGKERELIDGPEDFWNYF